MALGGESEPRVVGALSVTGNYFQVLGTRPAIGRFFLPEESFYPEIAHAAVVSHTLWQSRFGGRADVIGATLEVNGLPVEVIGVAPEGFGGHAAGLQSDVFLPLGVPAPGLRGGDSLDDWSSSAIEGSASSCTRPAPGTPARGSVRRPIASGSLREGALIWWASASGARSSGGSWRGSAFAPT